jgi:hypothetical protein
MYFSRPRDSLSERHMKACNNFLLVWHRKMCHKFSFWQRLDTYQRYRCHLWNLVAVNLFALSTFFVLEQVLELLKKIRKEFCPSELHISIILNKLQFGALSRLYLLWHNIILRITHKVLMLLYVLKHAKERPLFVELEEWFISEVSLMLSVSRIWHLIIN